MGQILIGNLNGMQRIGRLLDRTLGAVILGGIILSLGPARLLGQVNVGSIVGTVTDASGGIVVGANVTAVNPATNDRRTVKTNGVGDYVFYDLPPATYSLAVEYTGFKTVTRERIILDVAEKIRVNFTLEPGAVSQRIEVTGASPLLQPETSSLGTVITEQSMTALPLNGRNVYDLVKLTPGVSPNDAFGSGGVPYGGSALNEVSVNGGRNLTNSFMLDDTDNIVSGYNAIAVIPPLDAVQEFNVLTNSFSAKYGRSGGGIVTTVTKSGTNQFHGDVWEFLRNNALDANDFFSNEAGSHLPPFRQNQFGVAAGGPIRRDKTFWFATYEGFRWAKGAQGFLTVPTDLEKAGDFSQTYTYDSSGNPALMKIYNPFTTTTDVNGNFVRQQFPGNVIPSAMFDPVSKNILQYYPEPNLPGDPVTHANNFFYSAPNTQLNDSFLGRIDHTISDRQRIFGRYNFTRNHYVTGNKIGNIADEYAATTLNRSQGLSLAYTDAISPTTVLNVRYGLVRQTVFQKPDSLGFDPAKLGLPASTVKQFETPIFPEIDVSGFTTVGAFIFNQYNNGGTTNSLAATLSKVIGRHSLEVGVDLRLIQGFVYQPGWPSGQFTFDAGFTHGMEANNPDPNSGNGFASFLLGADSGNFASYDPHWFFTNRYYAGYIQDDIKVDPKLTLNLGLRYDYEAPYHDRHDQLSWVDYKTQIPIAVPQVTVPGVGQLPKEPFLGGGAMFPNVNGSGPVQVPQRKDFGPRVGLAYSIDSKTVIRTGYGIIYPGTTADNSGNFPTVQGFNPITQTLLAPDGYTPLQRSDRGFLLSNPFPNGLSPVQGSKLGLLTSIGNGDHALEHVARHAYFQQWNFGIQRQLPGDVLIEAAYVGSHGVHLADYNGYNADQLPDQYLALGNSLYNSYANPFVGVVPASSTLGSSPTLTLQQLLAPYPEFTLVLAGPDYQASSNYSGFQFKAQKRTSHGLTFLAAYTASKQMDTASGTAGNHNGTQGYQDNFNRRLDYSLSAQDRSQILVLSPIYQLPFGRGKPIGASLSNRAASQLISGWEVSSILTFATGFPLGVSCVSGCTFPANRPDLVANPNQGSHGSDESRLNGWFNTAAWAPNQLFQYGTSPRILPSTRGPGTNVIDFSLIKDTRFMERYNVQFRFESFNFMNRPQFGQPDTGFGDTTFGVISSTRSGTTPREIQFGLKFYW